MNSTAFDRTDPATALGLPPDRTFWTTRAHLEVIAERTGAGVRIEKDWIVVAVDADTPDGAWWVARAAALIKSARESERVVA